VALLEEVPLRGHEAPGGARDGGRALAGATRGQG
jgi:hypothetical protein